MVEVVFIAVLAVMEVVWSMESGFFSQLQDSPMLNSVYVPCFYYGVLCFVDS